MGRIYTAQFRDITVSAAGELLQLSTSAGICARILKWEITSSAVTPQSLRLATAFAGTAGSGGTALAEVARNTANTVVAGASALVKNSVAASSLSYLESYEWEQMGPVGEVFTPELAPELGVSKSWVLILESAPTEFKMAGNITWLEI